MDVEVDGWLLIPGHLGKFESPFCFGWRKSHSNLFLPQFLTHILSTFTCCMPRCSGQALPMDHRYTRMAYMRPHSRPYLSNDHFLRRPRISTSLRLGISHLSPLMTIKNDGCKTFTIARNGHFTITSAFSRTQLNF
jgi:hypothetical protein